MDQEKISLLQSRDFGETFNVSVKFLRQNFKLFFKSILLIAGPFLLISGIAGAFYSSHSVSMMSITNMMANSSNPFALYGWTFLLFMLASVIANIILLATVYSFMLNYLEKGPNGFTVNDVAGTLLRNLGKIFVLFFVLSLIAIILIVILVFIIAAIASMVPVLGILIGVGAFFGIMILFPPLMWQLSVVYLVRMQEGGGVFDSFGRTSQVMKGNFWWTWLIVVCSSIAVSIIGAVFTLPQIIYQMVLMVSSMRGGDTETSIPFFIVVTICTFFSSLTYSIIHVINAMHYFSLNEKKFGKGLMEKINEIGNTPDNNVNQQY
jgi:hypothetical protein